MDEGSKGFETGKKKKKKRKRKKVKKAAEMVRLEEVDHGDEDKEIQEMDDAAALDEFQLLQVIRVKQKIRSFSFSRAQWKKNLIATVALSLHNNTLEVHEITSESASRAHVVELPGHRSDIKNVTLSSDSTLLMSTSHNTVKIWNPMTGSCLHTIESGYELCGVIVPGNQHAVVGTKIGALEILNIGASECVKEIQAHSGAIWSVTQTPNGKGFVSGGADHDVKFWDYELVQDKDSATKILNVANVRTLKMAQDDPMSVLTDLASKWKPVAIDESRRSLSPIPLRCRHCCCPCFTEERLGGKLAAF